MPVLQVVGGHMLQKDDNESVGEKCVVHEVENVNL